MIHTALLILLAQGYAPILLMDFPSLKRIKVLEVKRKTDYRSDKSDILCKIGSKTVYVTYNHIDHSLSANALNDLWYQRHGGSGDLGICMIGLPGIVLFSPIWLSVLGLFKVLDKLFGMDRWSWSFYLRIGSQLDPNLREKVKAALRSSFIKDLESLRGTW